MKYVYPCVVRGFHVYKVYWDPVIGETLTTQPDPDGRKFGDKHSVAVVKDGMTCGHVPNEISCLGAWGNNQMYGYWKETMERQASMHQ